MKILISGFEPFGSDSINPSEKLVRALETGEITVPAHMEVRTIVLPVTYGSSYEVLSRMMFEFQPDVVLALGQAGGRASFGLERVAINLCDSEQPDNEKTVKRDEAILPTGPIALLSTLPLKEMRDALRTAQIPAEISNSAGTFVCNDLFYRLQSVTLRSLKRSGFVHVPYLPEQTTDKPSLSWELSRKGLEVLLAAL